MIGWWDNEPRENVWLEITRRDDVGQDLKAPSEARGGKQTPGYALLDSVRPGDVIVHYDSAAERIVGASIATRPSEPTSIFWAARGTYARRAGEVPAWKPGVRVPLADFIVMRPPLTLDDIRARQDDVLGVRDELKSRYPRFSLYFPWNPYGSGPLRTFQSYLAKMPRSLIALFPDLEGLVAAVEGSSVGPIEIDDPAEPVLDEAGAGLVAAGPVRRGQGFLADVRTRILIETVAMQAAYEYFEEEGWVPENVSTKASFDYRCRRGDEELHVEVKGTTTAGEHVLLTRNEVLHAREANVALFVYAGVRLVRLEGGVLEAEGGQALIFNPWDIDEGELEALTFRYRVPERRVTINRTWSAALPG